MIAHFIESQTARISSPPLPVERGQRDRKLITMKHPLSWDETATGHLSFADLQRAKNQPVFLLVRWLVRDPHSTYGYIPTDEAACIAELSLHGNDRKAKALTHAIIRRRPEARESLEHILGSSAMSLLLEK